MLDSAEDAIDGAMPSAARYARLMRERRVTRYAQLLMMLLMPRICRHVTAERRLYATAPLLVCCHAAPLRPSHRRRRPPPR